MRHHASQGWRCRFRHSVMLRHGNVAKNVIVSCHNEMSCLNGGRDIVGEDALHHKESCLRGEILLLLPDVARGCCTMKWKCCGRRSHGNIAVRHHSERHCAGKWHHCWGRCQWQLSQGETFHHEMTTDWRRQCWQIVQREMLGHERILMWLGGTVL